MPQGGLTLDLNEVVRDVLLALRAQGRLPSLRDLAAGAEVGLSQINRMLQYPKYGGASLETLSRVIDGLALDPVSFFLIHERYAASLADPQAQELRSLLTADQFRELVDFMARLRRRGALDPLFAAIRGVLRVLPKMA